MRQLSFSVEDVFIRLPRYVKYTEYYFSHTLYGFYGVIGLKDNTYITSDDISKLLSQFPVKSVSLEKACAVCSDIINDTIKKDA